ncbi:MAG: bifunctional 4-hydroxy-2-oxoglutarate aldolase/2-dehydro-3-deoxy-phosphogluconate aldolase [Clostridia bacterium]|nr:bifunctional 4-hydroxy-2-oxoglutarate aldolase/2-dehydro-3-deoxy-phosphogluconate aldolase [Clostridia bacterium]
MTVQLSEDDGKTWRYKVCLDPRNPNSYPDADYRDGKIYLIYDRGRTTHKEIIFAAFTEEDIIKGNKIELNVISKPLPNPDREGVINSVLENKLIAIIRGVNSEKLIPMAEALFRGGIRLLEITYSADGSTPDTVTAENIKALAEHFKGRMFIGAGTVLTAEQVRLTRAAGGQFIISPNVKEEVIRETYRLGMVSMPGALTPTEIESAHEFGADFVKLFPISDLGAGYVKAVKAPLSNVKLLAVGGINENNMSDYLAAGVCGFGIGSNITDKKLIEAEDWDGITRLAERFVKAVN